MKYENITTFKLTTKASKSKIYRFYKKNEELWNETQLKYLWFFICQTQRIWLQESLEF
jgi:hypothetical protein